MFKILKDFLNLLITTLIVVIMFDLIVNDPISDPLLKYQSDKINNSKQIKNIFVGDSSCGNSIDSKLFEEGTYNLSLTGDYNIINTYRIIQRAFKKNDKIKNVYVMQTFDVFQREDEQIFNIDSEELSFYKRILTKIKSLKYFLTIRPFTNFEIFNDHLKQSAKYNYKGEKLILAKGISSFNKKSILMIKDFCEKRKINYTFLFGPSIPIEKNKFYYEIVDFFKINEINLIEDFYELHKENIGDGKDHVSYDFKSESTLFYKKLID